MAPEHPREHTLEVAPTIGRFLGHTRIAYFSMEMALRPEMHTYSGGLGILAGDTARAAADLQLPMVFVTLVSRAGYLRQEIDADGNQVEHPDPWSPFDYAVPLRAKVALMIEGHEVWVRPWLHVLEGALGQSVPVLLLDTDLDENRAPDRRITDVLYVGDEAMRLKQEAVLGIGGLRLLQALGFRIRTYHLNEGHAALLALDLLRRYPRPVDQVGPRELKFDVAPVREACIFTTHTPVEAGHDRYSYELFGHVLQGYIEAEQARLLAGSERLNMTRLGINLCGFINGVAASHAQTTTRMFPGYDIRAITNGIHVPSWAHPAFCALFNDHSRIRGYDPVVMVRFDQIPDEQVWAAHEHARNDLFALVAERSGVRLDPGRALIGFARRMTAYKRPDLLFSDIVRLRAINARWPMQLLMGGKAHPQDAGGRALIRRIHELIRDLAPEIPVVFLPNYDLALAKALVAGVDIWLNTPEPPLEASGTSGMKAAINGVLNLSVLDGWWIEAHIEGVTGWAIGDGGDGVHSASAAHLYDKLEGAVLPLFYEDRPRWIWIMKQSIGKLGSYFNSHRMMRRYAAEAYIPRQPSWRPAPRATHPV